MTNNKLYGTTFYGNEASDYAKENGRLDYSTLAKSFDAVLNNNIMQVTAEIGCWETENGNEEYYEDNNGNIYTYNEKEKIVCACEDFTDGNNVLYEFENLALSTNPDKKIETELADILEVIEETKMMIPDNTKEKFWDMFIIDSLIGNTDRHNGNWGFLVNARSSKVEFAPIYDCGSCLNPMLEDMEIERLNETEFKNLAINCYSCIKENGKKINYITYIKSMKHEECNEAIYRVFKKINIEEINEFIDEIPAMSDVRKQFYKNIIKLRYDIIKEVYDKLNKF